jgi:hypothetical protein
MQLKVNFTYATSKKQSRLGKISNYLEARLNERFKTFLFGLFKLIGLLDLWDLIQAGKISVSGSTMQRLLDISPCFGTPASFGSFSSSDVDIYTNNLESFNAIRESYAKTTPAYYDSHYGFKSTFRFDAYHNGVAISINVIAPAVNKSVDTCIRGYDLSYLAISFTSGLFLYLTKIKCILSSFGNHWFAFEWKNSSDEG